MFKMINKPNVLIFTSKVPSDETPDSLTVPIGIYSLQHVLKSDGIRCDVIDHQFNTESDYLENVENGLYDIIGISVTHWQMQEDLSFLHVLKSICRRNNKQCLFIAGGIQATINYPQWLDGGFDLVCLGYAEDTLLDICHRIAHASSPIHELFKNCEGVAFLNKDGVVHHNPTKSLSNHDFEQIMYGNVLRMNLPYPNYWEFIRERAAGILKANNRSYIIENGRLLTTSKCMAKCGFCCSPNFLKNAQGATAKPLCLSPQQVMELIVHGVSKYGAKSFSINDEDFLIGNTYGIERAIAICDLIVTAKQKNEIPRDIRFSCQTRAHCFLSRNADGSRSVNHQLMQALSRAGFHNVSIGVETFSDRLLKSPSINKGVTSKNLHAVLHGLIENNLYTSINLILGIPEGTIGELLDTIWQALEYTDKPCHINLAIRMLSFPGSAIFDMDKYPTFDSIFVNPDNGKKILIKKYYKQHDPEMERILKQVEGATKGALEKFKSERNLGKSMLLPRLFISLIILSLIAKYANDDELSSVISRKIKHFYAGI